MLLQGVLRHVQGKTIGVVKPEGRFARQLSPLGQISNRRFKQSKTAIQGRPETIFFAVDGVGHEIMGCDQLRKRRTHLVNQGWNQQMHDRILGPQHMNVPHCPPHDPAENIAPSFIGRQNAVADQKRR